MAVPDRDIPAYGSYDTDGRNLVSIERTGSPAGIRVFDQIERRRIDLITDNDNISPVDIPCDEFYMPVDRGVEIHCDHIRFPHSMPVSVRNSWGVTVDELSNGDTRQFPDDQYSIDLNGPMKVYLNFRSSVEVSSGTESVTLDFPNRVAISIGFRSYHEHPAAEITVTEDPLDMMEGLSYFGSALKTLSCERSYPTLRGHPPTIGLGDDLDIPDVLDKPESGITLELPKSIPHIFVASTLAYYLGAEVVPGTHARLTTDSGFSYDLSPDHSDFESTVERVLKQVFFLDCLTRTEGFYEVDLHERNQIEPYVDIDFQDLYPLSVSEQVEQYLDVPYEVIKDEIPKWKLGAHVVPESEYIEHIPFLVNDLAAIRTAQGDDISQTDMQLSAIEDFMRADSFVRGSTRSTSFSEADVGPLVQPDSTTALEQAWVGPNIPVGASKAIIEAFENSLERHPTDGNIEISVICNDSEMRGERDIVNDAYGSRDDLEFEIDVHRAISREELRGVLTSEVDFLHFIGHIDERGFECRDGMLDVSSMEEVGVTSFFLNACTSYEQGRHLIEAGSVAGVATLNEVVNSGAEIIGVNLAKLLNRGFPLRAALNVAKTQSLIGNQYIVLGDGNVDIAQPASGTALLLKPEHSDDTIRLTIETYPTSDFNIGTIFVPYLDGHETFHLCSGPIGPFDVSLDDVSEYFQKENFPVMKGHDLHWTSELTADDLFD